MRKFFLRIVVGIVTFVVGLSAAYVADKFWTTRTATVIIVEPFYKAETGIPRFSATARACRPGYSQFYVTDDEQPLVEGVSWNPSGKVIRRDFRKFVRGAKKVVERVPRFQGYPGRAGERVVVVNQPDEQGKESVSILFYDGGDSYRFIISPTLDLALEFEQYLISIDFKSAF